MLEPRGQGEPRLNRFHRTIVPLDDRGVAGSHPGLVGVIDVAVAKVARGACRLELREGLAGVR